MILKLDDNKKWKLMCCYSKFDVMDIEPQEIII